MTPEGKPLLPMRKAWIGSHLERDFEEEVEADEEEIYFPVSARTYASLAIDLDTQAAVVIVRGRKLMKEDLYRPQRNWGARILEYRYKGLRAVFLENELLRVRIIADKGTDVFEFNYKPDGGHG